MSSNAPERIWRNTAYSDFANMNHGIVAWANKELADVDATEYVRTDIAQARIAALEAENERLREALTDIAYDTESSLQSNVIAYEQHARAALGKNSGE